MQTRERAEGAPEVLRNVARGAPGPRRAAPPALYPRTPGARPSALDFNPVKKRNLDETGNLLGCKLRVHTRSDAIYTLLSNIEQERQAGSPVHCAMIDFETAFPSVSRAQLYHQLPQNGIKGILRIIKGAARRAESESPVARHISQGTGDITCNHIAFNHLGNLRSANLLGARIIDSEGNFIGNRHRPEAGGPAWDHAQREKFLPWWKEEFLETEYKMDVFPRGIVGAIFLIVVPSLGIFFAPVGSLPEDCPAHSWAMQGTVRFSKVSAPACLLYRATLLTFFENLWLVHVLGSFIARCC